MESKRILIVDDNDLNRKLFENLLSQFYRIDTAKNGLEALEKLEEDSFDLVLMDIQMPTLDGISAMKRIRNGEKSETKILAITAFADESERENFLTMGFDEFLTKPIRPREFLQTVKGVISSTPFTPEKEKESPENQLEILNRKTIFQLMKYNSREAMEAVFQDFIADCDSVIATGKNLDNLEKLDDFALEIHSLKGNSGTLGAEKIYEVAKESEGFARKNMKIELQESLKSLEFSIIEFKKHLLEFNFEQ